MPGTPSGSMGASVSGMRGRNPMGLPVTITPKITARADNMPLGIRMAFLFGDDFYRADRRIVHGRSEVDLNLALWRGFNVLEGFH